MYDSVQSFACIYIYTSQMASRRLKVTRALTGPKTYYIIVIGNSETEENGAMYYLMKGVINNYTGR